MIPGVMTNFPVILAPLAGWSDGPFRLLAKEFGADMVYTEMVSADGAVREQEKTLALAQFTDAERPLVIQVFGAEPDVMAGAVEIISSMKPDYIDINFGCPARKVVKRGAGAALLRDLDLLQRVAQAAVNASDIPIAAKLRSGWDTESINVVEASQRLQDIGVQLLAIHPRTQTQQFKGHSDWSLITKVKKSVSIPVIGNGDVKSPFDAQKMKNDTGCDAVMLGRAVCGNPWLFRQVKDYLELGLEPTPPTLQERLDVCIRHLRLSAEAFGPERTMHMMKKQVALYLKGFPDASELRQQVFSASSFDVMINVLASTREHTFEHIV
jgi:nifR3 family TIM-barrel protein